MSAQHTPNPFRYIPGCLTNPSPSLIEAMDAYLKARTRLFEIASLEVAERFIKWADGKAKS